MISLNQLALAMMLILLVACGKSTPTPAVVKSFLPLVFQSPPVPAAHSPSIPSTAPVTPTAAPRLTAFYRSGQTFLTWPERTDLNGEVYRIYRSNAPIDASNLAQARFLIQVGKHSARVWANYYVDKGQWQPRLTDRFIIGSGAQASGAKPLAEGVGALVWTLAPEDFNGQTSGVGYYAVTVSPAAQSAGNTAEKTAQPEQLSAEYLSGPVQEAVADPQPVEIINPTSIHPGSGAHYYLQYMDLRHWNPTFHAPNTLYEYYGQDPKDPNLTNALAYTYDYSIFEPTPDLCGGTVPDTLPVMIFLHGARGNRYGASENYPYPYCAYGVYPIDQSDTWYFGFARNHDYRKNDVVELGDLIENYTEQRVLRMLADLMRDPPGPPVDTQRVYLFGHSMGGTGALAFAERYPNVFAAVYSGQPVTQFRAVAGYDEPWPGLAAARWGAQALNLPVSISAPNSWAAHLQKYNGTGVYDWENLRGAFDPQSPPDRSGDEMVPFGIDHGTIDDAVLFPTQGQPLYPLLDASPRAWAGAVTRSTHQWSSFGWPLPSLGKRLGTGGSTTAGSTAADSSVPFWNLRVIRDETVPGLSLLSGNQSNPPAGPTTYNQTILWSASWNPWDGAPTDRADAWQMSFCSVKAGEQECGNGAPLTVSITPRRLQQFVVIPGRSYAWENRRVSDGKLIASGTVVADQKGLLTISNAAITTSGNRLLIRPQNQANEVQPAAPLPQTFRGKGSRAI